MFVKVGYFKVRICYCLPSVFPAPLYQILVIYLLRHDGCRAFHPQVSPSFVRERTHISLFFRRQCDDTFASVWYFSIRNFNCGKRLDTPDRVRYIPLGFVAHVLSDDFSLVGDTEQYRAAFAVKEGAKRFHAALQLSGGFLELHPSAFFFGYQPFYYVEVVYAHIQFCKVGTKIVLFAGFRANR